MSTKYFLPIAFLLILIFYGTAFADIVCLKSKLKNGRIRNITKTIPENTSCPKRFAKIFSAAQNGLQGPQGVQGPRGPQGPEGAEANVNVDDFTVVFAETNDKSSTDSKSLGIECPSGTQMFSCSGGVEDGLGVPSSLPVAISYSGVNRFGNCTIRAFETTSTSGGWGIFGTALCIDI